MAYKVFSNGNALTGGELNTFLMNQSVISFASVAARNAALPAPLEGQLVWLEDSNKYVYYTGTAWTDLIVPVSSGNAIINGGFDIWQRGTSVANTASYTQYVTDRWQANRAALATGATISRQAGTTDIRYAARVQRDSGNTNTGAIYFMHTLETADSIRFAGQTVTVSFYARAGANFSSTSNALSVRLDTGTGTDQSLGGALTGQTSIVSQTATLTTSFQRFSYTATVGSSATQVGFYVFNTPTGTAGANDWFEITGVQLESGSTATAFKRNANSIQGELAACQRYYYRSTASTSSPYGVFSNAFGANSSTQVFTAIRLPVTMRAIPTSVDFSTLQLADGTNLYTVTACVLDPNTCTADYVSCGFTVSSGLTQYRPYVVRANNSANGFLGFDSELK